MNLLFSRVRRGSTGKVAATAATCTAVDTATGTCPSVVVEDKPQQQQQQQLEVEVQQEVQVQRRRILSKIQNDEQQKIDLNVPKNSIVFPQTEKKSLMSKSLSISSRHKKKKQERKIEKEEGIKSNVIPSTTAQETKCISQLQSIKSIQQMKYQQEKTERLQQNENNKQSDPRLDFIASVSLSNSTFGSYDTARDDTGGGCEKNDDGVVGGVVIGTTTTTSKSISTDSTAATASVDNNATTSTSSSTCKHQLKSVSLSLTSSSTHSISSMSSSKHNFLWKYNVKRSSTKLQKQQQYQEQQQQQQQKQDDDKRKQMLLNKACTTTCTDEKKDNTSYARPKNKRSSSIFHRVDCKKNDKTLSNDKDNNIESTKATKAPGLLFDSNCTMAEEKYDEEETSTFVDNDTESCSCHHSPTTTTSCTATVSKVPDAEDGFVQDSLAFSSFILQRRASLGEGRWQNQNQNQQHPGKHQHPNQSLSLSLHSSIPARTTISASSTNDTNTTTTTCNGTSTNATPGTSITVCNDFSNHSHTGTTVTDYYDCMNSNNINNTDVDVDDFYDDDDESDSVLSVSVLDSLDPYCYDDDIDEEDDDDDEYNGKNNKNNDYNNSSDIDNSTVATADYEYNSINNRDEFDDYDDDEDDEFYDGNDSIDDLTAQSPIHQSIVYTPISVESLDILYNRRPSLLYVKDTYNGYLPLHLAITSNRSSHILSYLLQHHPDAISIADNNGNLPIHLAASHCCSSFTNTNTTMSISSSVASINTSNHSANTIRTSDRNNNNNNNNNTTTTTENDYFTGVDFSVHRIKLLHDCYPDGIISLNNTGQIPLHLSSHNVYVTQYLLQHYPDGIYCNDNNGYLPFHTALFEYTNHVISTISTTVCNSCTTPHDNANNNNMLLSSSSHHSITNRSLCPASSISTAGLLVLFHEYPEAFLIPVNGKLPIQLLIDACCYSTTSTGCTSSCNSNKNNNNNIDNSSHHTHTQSTLQIQQQQKAKTAFDILQRIVREIPTCLQCPIYWNDTTATTTVDDDVNEKTKDNTSENTSINDVVNDFEDSVVVKKTSSVDIDVEIVPAIGTLPLHYACTIGAPPEVLLFLSFMYPHALVHYDELGYTPIHIWSCNPLCCTRISSYFEISSFIQFQPDSITYRTKKIQHQQQQQQQSICMSNNDQATNSCSNTMSVLLDLKKSHKDEENSIQEQLLPVQLASENDANIDVIHFMIQRSLSEIL